MMVFASVEKDFPVLIIIQCHSVTQNSANVDQVILCLTPLNDNYISSSLQLYQLILYLF